MKSTAVLRAGDPSRSNILAEIKGLNWQTNVSASAEVKSVFAALANVEQALGEHGRALYDAINACSDVHHLDEAAGLLWKGYGEGRISDSEAMYLDEAVRRRRPPGRRTGPGSYANQVCEANGRVPRRFAPRRRSRSLGDQGAATEFGRPNRAGRETARRQPL
jgi:hypothetical protein